MVWSLFEKKKILGLDIGSHSIKLAELDVGRGGSTLNAFAMLPTPPNAFDTGDILDTSAIAEVVRNLIRQIKTKRNRVAVGLGGSSVIVKLITIPKMDENLISEQIRWEAEQYIPYDINEVNLGFEVVRKNPETMDLLLVAAVHAHVMKYAEMTQLAAVNCETVDVNGFALANCFYQNYGKMEGQNIALLNVGDAASSLVISENGVVVFSRDIPVGGATYTQDLQKALDVSDEEAESLKLSLTTGEAPEEALQTVSNTHDVVVDEIKASFDFYFNTSKNAKVDKLFVTGGASKTSGFIDKLSAFQKAEKLNPFFSVKVNTKNISQSYQEQIADFAAVAVGLGLRKAGDNA